MTAPSTGRRQVGMTNATMQLIERVERLEMTGEIGYGTVAQLHDLAAMARLEQGARWQDPDTIRNEPLPTGPHCDQPTATPMKARACGAYACGDQMLCPCGLAWDIADDDPPGCPRGGR